MNTTLRTGTVLPLVAAPFGTPLATLPSMQVVSGLGVRPEGAYPVAGACLSLHEEKSGATGGFAADGKARNAQTTDLRGIPPRGSAPV